MADFIIDTLQEDNLQFHSPLHRKMLREIEQQLQNPNFIAEKYFVAHPDPEISRLAAEIASDRYQLSKYHFKAQKIVTDKERLHELIPRLVIDFKISIVDEEMKQTLRELSEPAVQNDPEQSRKIMQRYIELQQIQSAMAKRAGERILLI